VIFSPRARRSRWRLAQLIALERHRLHPLGQQVRPSSGMASVSTSRSPQLPKTPLPSQAGIGGGVNQEIEHEITSEVEVDHLAHDHHAMNIQVTEAASIIRPATRSKGSSMYWGFVM